MKREHVAVGDGKASVSSAIAAGRGTPGCAGVPPACARSAHKKKMPAGRRRTQGLRDMFAFAEAMRCKRPRRAAP